MNYVVLMSDVNMWLVLYANMINYVWLYVEHRYQIWDMYGLYYVVNIWWLRE